MDEDPLNGHPRYEKIKFVGRGGHGFVFHAKDKVKNEEVAIKFLPRGQHIDKHVDREVINYKHLLHPHVIQFKDVFLTTHYLAIVMEYAAGGNLQDHINDNKGISEEMARWFFQQLIIGLDYIHGMHVANRDIKLKNILLTDDPWPIVKICDFGLCKSEEFDSDPHSFVGTRPYMAPEVVLNYNREDLHYDGMKADIWSCGVSLYVMLVRHYPFERPHEDGARDMIAIYQRILNGQYHIPEGHMSAGCADLIQKILVVVPQERLGIPEIQQHEWYQQSLPPNALTMNNELESQIALSDDEVRALLEQARHVQDPNASESTAST